MLNKDSVIGVSSRSFCKSKYLRESLESNFKNVIYNEELLHFDEKALIKFFDNCQGIIVSEDIISVNVIDNLPNLKVVCKFGVGLDNIDTEYLKKKNIKLGWKPGLNSSSVAELALSYIILMLREAYYLNRKMLNLKWEKVINSRDLTSSTIGIIGFGHIGQKLASYLIPHECNVLVFDPLLEINKDLSINVRSTSLENVLKTCDAVSIHVPLNSKTKNLIGKKEIYMMKKGSVLINLARGEIVDESFLYEALKNNHLCGAAFDVFANEPSNSNKFTSSLLDLENFFCTPHIAGTSTQTIKRLGESAINCLIENYQN